MQHHHRAPDQSQLKRRWPWLALGKVRREGICEEAMKLFIEIQLVKVQPGQSRSGQAGSECCHAVGRRFFRTSEIDREGMGILALGNTVSQSGRPGQ